MRVLVVEDEIILARNIAQLLREACGYAVDISYDGLEGFHLASEDEYDLLILDLMLPNLDGLQLLQKLRATGKATPVLILTARSQIDDLLTGLDFGADDYLRKPFDLRELLARSRALIRRYYRHTSDELRVKDLSLNTKKRSVSVNNIVIEVTAMEFRTLEYLLMRKGEVVSKTEISEHLYVPTGRDTAM